MGERVGKELRTHSTIASDAESPLVTCGGKEQEPAAKNLVITIHLKKMEPSGTKPSLEPKDPKPGVSKSGVVEPYNGLYNLFKASPSDSNNNKGGSTSYPIVTPIIATTKNTDPSNNNCENIDKTSSGLVVAMTQELPQIFNDISRRLNEEDCDERARIKRAREIAEGVEIDQVSPTNLSIQSQPLNLLHANQMLQLNPTPQLAATLNQQSQNPCFLCSTDLFHLRQFGLNGHTILPNVDGEIPRIHSQDFYIHCLVPDLQKITACCFYWGKMDRYEAEKLLDGKPEGTFLLRDSAQDDFLFSVSFRKYGRSLHARIEQFNHLFSFDSHDPSVFTAPTVTALLEHYKDPTCVMFFEPMLTIPMNRSFCFSLASLSRAAIVSNCTYDGLNELCLPPAMQSFLREYHYKQRVRVKRFDEHIYANS